MYLEDISKCMEFNFDKFDHDELKLFINNWMENTCCYKSGGDFWLYYRDVNSNYGIVHPMYYFLSYGSPLNAKDVDEVLDGMINKTVFKNLTNEKVKLYYLVKDDGTYNHFINVEIIKC
jgi:hypothetical protein